MGTEKSELRHRWANAQKALPTIRQTFGNQVWVDWQILVWVGLKEIGDARSQFS